MLLVAARLQGAAQAADVGVDRALVEEYMVAPYLVEQLRTAVHALRMVHQEVEKAKFNAPQRQLLGAGGDPVRARVEPQAGHLHRVGGRVRRAPAQQGVDAGDHFARAERLGDVIVGARFERQDLVVLAVARRHHDDRHVARARMGAQAPDQRNPGLPRQVPFEQHHFRQRLVELQQGRLGVGHAGHPMAGARQVQPDQLLDRWLGFDDEDVC